MKLKLFLGFALVFGAILSFVTGHITAITAGFSLATVGTMYNVDLPTYRRLLSRKMQLVTANMSFWNVFLGVIGGGKTMFDPSPKFGDPSKYQKATGKPIEILRDFQNYKGVDMDVPVFYPLTGPAISGTLKGKGEKAKLAVQSVSINEVRKAYLEQDTKISRYYAQNEEMQRQLYMKSSDYLGDWFHRHVAYQPYLTAFEGASEILTRSAVNAGSGVSKSSHMNFYVQGSGQVAFSNTKATYEANVATAVSGLVAANVFSTETIENAVYVASHNHKIIPMELEGMRLYPMVISDAQALQLQADTQFKSRMTYAAERSLKSNPLFTGRVVGIYGGALIIVDETEPSIYVNGDPAISAARGVFSAARSTTGDVTGVCYGTEDVNNNPDYMDNPVDPGNRKLALLFGASFEMCGIAAPLSIDEELDDFKHKIEVGADMLFGMQRSDILDKSGSFGVGGDTRFENRSSLVIATYSPSSAVWS